MRKLTICIVLTTFFFACKKSLQTTDDLKQAQQETQSKKTPPPANANPVFAYQDYKKINNQLTVPAISVMDVNGANATVVYTNYSGQGNNIVVNRPDHPAWSADGTKLCFTLNEADLYTLNISIVNGVPTGSGATKIADGVAAVGSYKQGKWRPGANQIASVWKKTNESDKIYLLPSAGGSPTVLYTTSAGWTIEDDIAFKSDGSNLVFSERQVPTGNVFLKVLDLNSNSIIKSIDLSQYRSIREIDWTKSSGSNIVAITTVPYCDGTTVGNSGMHQLQTIDVSALSPSLTLLRNDQGNISWSPDDTQITTQAGLGRACSPVSGCCSSQYYAFQIFTLASQAFTFLGNNNSGSNHPDWKR